MIIMKIAGIAFALFALVECKPGPANEVDAGVVVKTQPDVAAPEPVDPVVASLAFLAMVDKLMDGFVPALPASADDTDVLRCVTTRALDSDPKLKAAGEKLVARRNKALKEREKRMQELYALSFRIDYDWQTKKRDIVAVYACCDTPDGVQNAGNCDSSYSAGECQQAMGLWAAIVPADIGKYLYTGSVQPPTTPPELMRRVQKAGLTIPARFSCRVDDETTERMVGLTPSANADAFVEKNQEFTIVDCTAPTGLDVVLRLSGAAPNLNSGDVVSVPFAIDATAPGLTLAVHRPDGVLLRTMGERRLRWTVDADATGLTIDVPAACPTVSDILSTAKK